MRAVVFDGTRSVVVADVPDAVVHDTTDALVRITSSAICGCTCTTQGPVPNLVSCSATNRSVSWRPSGRLSRLCDAVTES